MTDVDILGDKDTPKKTSKKAVANTSAPSDPLPEEGEEGEGTAG